jgi:TonB family protein
MTKLQQDPHYRHCLYLLAFLLVCAAEIAHAQDPAATPRELPVIVDRKQADSLVVAQIPPDYPPIAKVNLIQGQVQLELTVSGKGTVTHSHVLRGNAILAESALKATLRWLYHPLTTPAGPSGFITTVRLKYTLNYKGTDLTPQQAERDFMRQVKAPQAVPPPDDGHSVDLVHVRVLINE